MTEITRRPTLLAAAVAGTATVVAIGSAGLTSTNALAIGAVGGFCVAVGLGFGIYRGVDLGCLVLFGAVVESGLTASVELTLIGTIAVIVAWDLGRSSIDLGKQLGRESDTARLETAHAVSSLIVGLATLTLGYAVYVFAASGLPVDALVLLLIAGAAATVALGTRDGS